MENNKPWHKRWWVWVLIICICLGGIFDEAEKNADIKEESESVKEEKPIKEEFIETEPVQKEDVNKYSKMLVEDLFVAFDENPAKASNDYKGKCIEIVGRLGYIDEDGEYIVIWPFDTPWGTIRCNLKKSHQESIYSKAKNDEIIVGGKVIRVGKGYDYEITVHYIK